MMGVRSALAIVLATSSIAIAIACGQTLSPSADAPVDSGADASSPVANDGDVQPIDAGIDAIEGDGCVDCAPRRITSGFSRISSLAVDATHVYFAVYEPASYRKVPIGGGTPETILTTDVLGAATQVVLQADDILLSQYPGPAVRRTNKANTKTAIVHGCSAHFSIVAPSTTGLYASSSCNGGKLTYVYRYAQGDGTDTASAVISAGDDWDGGAVELYAYSKFGYLALDQQYVYLSNLRRIMRLPREFGSGQAPDTIHTLDVTDDWILNLVVDDFIYVRTRVDVRKYDKNPVGVSTPIIETPFHSDGNLSRLPLAVDVNDVYYSEIGPPAKIYRVGKAAGSMPVPVAQSTADVSVILLEGNFLYWATQSGEIWRVHK
jgi:hypothetical protein